MPVGSMTDGGWYVRQDSMTGTIFGFYSTTDHFELVEIMLYSQEAIQMKALSAVATNPNPSYPATNALEKIVVLFDTPLTHTCVTAPNVSGLSKVEINLKASGYINFAQICAICPF
jgi:hypothetical protein